MLAAEKKALHAALFETDYVSLLKPLPKRQGETAEDHLARVSAETDDEQEARAEALAVELVHGLVADLLAEQQAWYLIVKNDLGQALYGPYWNKNEMKAARKWLLPEDQVVEHQGRPAKFWVEPDTLPKAECEDCGHLKDAHCPNGSVRASSKSTVRSQPAGCLPCLREGRECANVYSKKGQWDTKTPRSGRR